MITCRQGKPMVTSEALQEGPPRMCITQVQHVHCQYFAMYHTMDTILCTYAGATCTILVRVMLYFAIPNYTAQGVHAGATCSMPILCIVPMDTLLCTRASGVRYFAILWTRVQRALSVCTYTGCDVTSPGSTCPALSSSSSAPP